MASFLAKPPRPSVYMVARNIDRALFTTLALALDPPGFGYYAAEEDESEDDDDNNNV